jgi:hypothetical protein
MTRICLFPLVTMLAVGCGSVAAVPLPDGSADGSTADAPAAIKAVRVDTPATVNAPSLSSSPLPLTVGNVVIAIAYWSDRSHRVAVTDSTGALIWKSIERQSVAQGCGDGTNLQMFYATIPSSGMVTVVATQPEGAGNMGLFVVEYSGLAADPLAGSAGMPAPRAANMMTTGALTTTSFDLLVAAFHDSNGSGTMVPGAGFTVLGVDMTSYAMIADQQAPAGSYEATARLPGTTSDACWVASVLALRAR